MHFFQEIHANLQIYMISLMSQTIYVGLDIGGTLSKVCIIANQQIVNPSTDIQLNGKHIKLFNQRFQSFIQCLSWMKIHIVPYSNQLKVCVTGGGATKYSKHISELFPNTEVYSLNQFQSNVKGIQFISKSNIPILIHQFVKISQQQVEVNINKTTLDKIELPLQFISLGSGVNFHKIGVGPSGFQRLKVEDPKASLDGYMLQGTCLGGGYIFGLIGLLSNQGQVDKVISLIKEDQTYTAIYSELLINLMQSAIQLSVIHNIPSILPTGSLLSIAPIAKQFYKSMLLTIQPLPFTRKLIILQALQGYLGCVGVLYSKMNKDKEQ